MPTGNQWSRRLFLVAAFTAVGATATCVFQKHKDREAFRELLRQAVAGLDIPCTAGEIFLSTGAGGEPEHDVQALVALLEDTLARMPARSGHRQPGGWSDADEDQLVGLLSESIRDDFSNDELCILDGWQLSRTECRLAALKYLWERDQADGAAPVCRKGPLRWFAPPPELSKIAPMRTFVGVPFNVQPNGKSAIDIHGSGFNHGTKVLFGDTVLRPIFGNPGWMTVIVPDNLISQAGTLDVTVMNPDGKTSNVMTFEVIFNQPPELSKIVPMRTFVGIPFNVQPNGKSAISVYGTGFNHGTEVLFGSVALRTMFGNPGWMTAIVPGNLISQAGTLDVTVRNPDGKTSNVMTFEVIFNQPPELSRIVPMRTFVGVPFNVQPNGKSAISLHGSGFNHGTEVLFGDTVLRPIFGNPGWMTVDVPGNLISQAGALDVTVRNPDGKTSNVMTFEVISKE